MIADAVAAAEREDWPACLSALLAAWRGKREPELAAVIDRVAARTSAPAVEARAPVIAARIRAATDLDIGPIIATILRQARTVPDIVRLAIELATTHVPDPRVATLVADFFQKSRYAREDGALEPGIADALDRIDDPRYRALLGDAAARLLPRRGRLINKRPRIDRLVEIARDIEGRRAVAPVTPDVRDAITAIDAALATIASPAHDHATLLAAIYADPANTAARLIYADALQEAGDPRGEFIALQCAGGPVTRRERKLEKLHARAWLGPIEPHLQKQGLVYRRGFLSAAIFNATRSAPTTVHSEWLTLEHLDCAQGWSADFTKLRAQLPALRRVDQIHPDDLPGLVELGPLPWTHLGVRYRIDIRELLTQRATFPALEVLDLTAIEFPFSFLEPTVEGELGAWLRIVRLRAGDFSADRIPFIRETAARLAQGGCALELVRNYAFAPIATGHVIRIAGDRVAFDLRPTTLGYIRQFVESLPTDWIRAVTTNHPLGDEITAALVAREIAITEVPPPDRNRA